MKKNLFRFSSRRFLFSTVMAFALVTGAPQAVFANVGEVQAVSQTGVIKGKIVDSYGEPVIGANAVSYTHLFIMIIILIISMYLPICVPH